MALAAALSQTFVQRLDLGGNGIGEEGMKALAASLEDSNVMSLVLEDNDIHYEAAEALFEGLCDSSLTEIGLEDCSLSDETYNKIQALVESNKARSFVLQMVAQSSENMIQLKFHTLAGTTATALTWSFDQPVQDLPKAIFELYAKLRVSASFQRPQCHPLKVGWA